MKEMKRKKQTKWFKIKKLYWQEKDNSKTEIMYENTISEWLVYLQQAQN